MVQGPRLQECGPKLMPKFFESIRHLEADSEKIRKRPYGIIEVCSGQLIAIHFRPWPKVVSSIEARWMGGWRHQRVKKDQCLLYFNQPLGHRDFLTLKYMVTTLGSSSRTVRQATKIFDQVARIKNSNAIVTEVVNPRITDRLMTRLGWARHCLHQTGRHYIKRFYGDFPPHTVSMQSADARSAPF